MTNKMEKDIQSSMLEGLLDDSDKPKPPAPKTTYYRGGGYGRDYYDDEYDWRQGDPLPSSMSDDGDIPAWMRELPQTQAPATRQRTSIFKQSERFQAPLGTPHVVSDLACDLLDEGTTRGTNHYMTADQIKRLVDLYMREIGSFNDRIGVCWSSEGSKIMRAGLEDLMGEMYFGTSRIMEADGFDPKTGELFDKQDGE